jgi:hypothetical protein
MTSSSTYIELDWEEHFDPLYGSPIIIPSNTLLWRGYDTKYDPISDRYAYYSSADIAMAYAQKQNRELGGFITTRPLKILDLRFMKTILSRIIQTNVNDTYIDDFFSCMISFGLCSLHHQIKMVEERYKKYIEKNNTVDAQYITRGIEMMRELCNTNRIIEQEGIRVAETTNDGIAITFLQELFKGLYDGFISPRLKTAFHMEKNGELTPEMIIFNPKQSRIKQITRVPHKRVIMPIIAFIRDKHQLINLNMIKSGSPISMKMFVSGGNYSMMLAEHPLDIFEDRLNNNDKEIKKGYDMAIKAGKRWRQKIAIVDPDTCSPEVECNKFTKSTFV